MLCPNCGTEMSLSNEFEVIISGITVKLSGEKIQYHHCPNCTCYVVNDVVSDVIKKIEVGFSSDK